MNNITIRARAVATIIATAVCSLSLTNGLAIAANATTAVPQNIPLQTPGKVPPAANSPAPGLLPLPNIVHPVPIPKKPDHPPIPLSWVRNDSAKCSGSPCVPEWAVAGGQEPGRTLYVCHSMFNNGTHPGKVVDGRCDITYGGREIQMPGFEWLVGGRVYAGEIPYPAYSWASSKFGESLPAGAFSGGQEPGRNFIVCHSAVNLGFGPNANRGIHPGKLVDGRCNVGYNGQELQLEVYDVLVAPR